MKNPFRRTELYDQDREEESSLPEHFPSTSTDSTTFVPSGHVDIGGEESQPTPEAEDRPASSSRQVARERVPLNVPSPAEQQLLADKSHRRSDSGRSVEVPLIGEGSKFAVSDWWDISHGKRWHKVPSSGLAADMNCDAGSVGDLAVCAASIRGWKHQVLGNQNEDSFYVGTTKDNSDNEYLLVIVADGLSSAKYSGYSARRSTQAIGRLLAREIQQESHINAESITRNLKEVLPLVAKDVLKYRVTDYGAPPDFASELLPSDVFITLTIALVSAALTSENNRQAVVAAIGDSPLYMMNSSGWSKITTEGINDEILDTQTKAFPAEVACIAQEITVDIDDVLVIASDGVGNFITDGQHTLALGAILQDKWKRPVDILSFLSHVNFNLKGADDDRTAVAIWSAVETRDTP